jgi:virulence-associated protein VagC
MFVEDDVEIMIADRQLIVTPLSEIERKRKIDDAIQSTFERRRKVYQKLAEGG